MRDSQVIGLLATAVTVPLIVFVAWFVDLFKPQGWEQRPQYDKQGRPKQLWQRDPWGYKTTMILAGTFFLSAVAFWLWLLGLLRGWLG
tara:strand:+ start:2082 stop:2345 length:264 start_codon:yes stop_codon:yes gene_type:complete